MPVIFIFEPSLRETVVIGCIEKSDKIADAVHCIECPDRERCRNEGARFMLSQGEKVQAGKNK